MTKILCVEDEKDLRENIALILKEEGYTVIEASDGEEALESFYKETPSLILCDINMPRMSGHDLLKKLKKDNPDKLTETPFIFLTALGQKQDFITGLDLGADEYIVKPIDFDILLSTIKSKLDKANNNQEYTNKKLDEFCDKVSHLLPADIKQPLENIMKISAMMKEEIFGAFVDRKYVDYATKIYMSSLRLNYQITKSLDKEKISFEVNNLSDKVSMETFFAELKEKFANQINFEIEKSKAILTVNEAKLSNAFKSFFEQAIKANAKNIAVNVFLDYENNLVVTLTCDVSLPLSSPQLEVCLDEHNAKFSVKYDEDMVIHIVSLPKHLITL
jgi:CheY-like chemotaxis protein